MFEFTSIDSKVLDLSQRNTSLKAYMLYDEKVERLEEVVGLLEDPDIWNNQGKLQELNKEKQLLENILDAFKNIDTLLSDVEVLIDIVKTDSQNMLLNGAKFKIYDAATGGNEVKVVNGNIEIIDRPEYFRKFLLEEMNNN